jgi:hypothetical protein
MVDENTVPMQQSVATNTPFPYHATSTMAAGMEMRSILGIEGRQPSSPPVYAGSNNFPTSVSTLPGRPVIGPVTIENCAQTVLPGSTDKDVQVDVEKTSQEVQTEGGPLKNDAGTQTSVLFVPAEDLTPAQDIQMESVGGFLQ